MQPITELQISAPDQAMHDPYANAVPYIPEYSKMQCGMSMTVTSEERLIRPMPQEPHKLYGPLGALSSMMPPESYHCKCFFTLRFNPFILPFEF